ncbi:hypothetical protein [Nocardia brasiliensis]
MSMSDRTSKTNGTSSGPPDSHHVLMVAVPSLISSMVHWIVVGGDK